MFDFWNVRVRLGVMLVTLLLLALVAPDSLGLASSNGLDCCP